MANIVVAWELGAGLGHLSRLAIIINRLEALGHNLALVLNDPTNLDVVNLPESLLVLPAPSFKTPPAKKQPTVSLPCILQTRGFQGPKVLRGIVRSWHGIFQITQPDLLIFDYAPTALLAARGLTCPKVIIGSGFAELEPGIPCEMMRTDLKEAPRMTKTMEARIVEVTNFICAELDYPRVKFLSDLYQNDLSLITTLPELDQYKRNPEKSLYLDLDNKSETNAYLPWRNLNGKRIFAYLRIGQSGVIETLEALAEIRQDVVCYCADAPARLVETYRRKGLQMSVEPLDTQQQLNSADLVISHAGKGLISESLIAGKPLMLLPTHMEQRMNASKVKALGAGLSAGGNFSPQIIKKMIKRLLDEKEYTLNAQKVAARYEGEQQLSSPDQMIERIVELLD
ncbi:glycosyltransferase [Neptuniibacter sp. QD34_54]|uniref:glycosyltransferase n=1 Tax=Neptuniibacter sp. QD34_54 TaxID=3398208 RepID=UPI0039F5EDB3